jgi:GNAT superfamily N-acetyltransferase
MRVEVSEESAANLEDYARIRMSFEVRHVLDVTTFSETKLDVPYLKDYDEIENPLLWPQSFDTSNWGVLVARADGTRVGGAIVVLLEDRTDIAVLWDIRVATEARAQGVGSALFSAAEKWALTRGCRRLNVETQNINVPACRFYAKQGCILEAANAFAYPELPDEVQMLWYKELT